MSDPSLSDPATNPDQSVVASQQAQPQVPANVAGSAMLDAQTAAGEVHPEGEPISAPIATNFPGATDAGDARAAGGSDVRDSSTGEQSSDKGFVNFQNNLDVPSDRVQNLPDADSLELPNNSETNLPD
ncbi:MAG: hypothetical protein KME10_21510 [Plectolyngbya sp. WJT66-NPBG17]|jgi:hypothetical protein|nr:hypothetical protein [Plectolyngbya sp. WJT66-NPBG17]MBW4526716.1 hypothetical protein [Phormidium tanganyikae FI6-MK23]